MNVKSLLLLIFVVCVLSLLVIFALKIKNPKEQVDVFMVILLMGILSYFFKTACYPRIKKGLNNFNTVTKEVVNVNVNAGESLASSAKEIDYEFTHDRIIPVKVYNPDDCTNDGTCIIPPSKANIYGFHEEKGENPFHAKDKLLTKMEGESALNVCERCRRPLTVENNPPTEIFEKTCDCNHCDREDKKTCLNNRLCVFCKVARIQNHACYSPKNMPSEYIKNN